MAVCYPEPLLRLLPFVPPEPPIPPEESGDLRLSFHMAADWWANQSLTSQVAIAGVGLGLLALLVALCWGAWRRWRRLRSVNMPQNRGAK
jgi:hypothetical protein